MRFMMLMIPKGYERAVPSARPTAERIAVMTRYDEALAKAGVLLARGGLHPPAMAQRVVFGRGKPPTVIDGPFAEANETVGGYWLIQVKSKTEALAWASRCPAGEGDVLELRQVLDPSDFADDELPESSPELSKVSPQYNEH